MGSCGRSTRCRMSWSKTKVRAWLRTCSLMKTLESATWLTHSIWVNVSISSSPGTDSHLCICARTISNVRNWSFIFTSTSPYTQPFPKVVNQLGIWPENWAHLRSFWTLKARSFPRQASFFRIMLCPMLQVLWTIPISALCARESGRMALRMSWPSGWETICPNYHRLRCSTGMPTSRKSRPLVTLVRCPKEQTCQRMLNSKS